MAEVPASLIFTAVTTLLSGGVSAVVTNSLNARRSTQEKLWELRRVAYGSMLAELRAVEYLLDAADEYIQEDYMRYFHEEASNRHNSAIAEHMTIVRKSYTENYLIISDEFINEFEKLLRSLDDRNPNLDPSEEHEEFASAVRAARPQLLRQARSEMPIKRTLAQRALTAWATTVRKVGTLTERLSGIFGRRVQSHPADCSPGPSPPFLIE